MAIKLRNYQEKQIEFLRRNESAEVKAIQSPTGTGKSIMILSYIKEYMEKNPQKTVVLSTGFNNLVFQMKEDADSLGIENQILIGGSYLIPNCGTENVNFSYNTKNGSKCNNCPHIKYKKNNGKIICDDARPENCSKKAVNNFIVGSHDGILIITNHSYYLTMKDRINCDLLVIDEAHTFSDFYSTFKTYKLSKEMKMVIASYCENVVTPTSLTIKSALNSKKIPERIIQNVIKEMINNKVIDVERGEKYKNQLTNLYADENEESFVENDRETDEIVKFDFFYYYDLPCKNIILLSATLDDYTLRMFRLTNKNQIFIQKEPLDRYKNSNYIPICKDFEETFPEICKYIDSNGNNGLILCMTLEHVKWVESKSKEELKNFEIFTDIELYKKSDCKKKILVGSKKYFQGINIPDLDFVILDKLPFPNYDNKFKSYEFYLKKYTKCDPWVNYTLPLVKNALLQAAGRLWRKNDYEKKEFDNGTFIVCDSRLNKFSNIRDTIITTKPGIKSLNLGD